MLQSVIPQLRITNAAKSLLFYVDGLEFSIDWVHQFAPNYPVFIQLTRHNQTIFLTEHAGDCAVGGAVYFVVDSADECWAIFQARGIIASKPIESTPWKTREFVLTDPDGNRLRFASNIEVLA